LHVRFQENDMLAQNDTLRSDSLEFVIGRGVRDRVLGAPGLALFETWARSLRE